MTLKMRRCSEFSSPSRMIPLKSLENLSQAFSSEKPESVSQVHEYGKKYSSPKYKMISQGMLMVHLLQFEEPFKPLADVQTSSDLCGLPLTAIYTTGYIFPPTKNSVALVRERTVPTERPPPVGEVSAKFCG